MSKGLSGATTAVGCGDMERKTGDQRKWGEGVFGEAATTEGVSNQGELRRFQSELLQMDSRPLVIGSH